MKFYIDIETTGTDHTSGIWDIGCAAISPTGDRAQFSQLCKPAGTSSVSTMKWIADQPHVAARFQEAKSDTAIPQAAALRALSTFITREFALSGVMREAETTRFYSWGNFDFPILENGLAKAGLPTPWKYWQVVDLRSVARFLDTDIRPDTAAHEALGDALALRTAHVAMLKELEKRYG